MVLVAVDGQKRNLMGLAFPNGVGFTLSLYSDPITYSPYQNLKPGQPYPRVFIETSTKDDRVHPAHARKAAARLKEYGYGYLYCENIDGGYAAAASLNERAVRAALEYTYLQQRLMD